MDKKIFLHIAKRYLSGEASPEEVTRFKAFLEQDTHLNRWLENQLAEAPAAIDPEIERRMLAHIRTQADYCATRQIPAGRKEKNFRAYLRRVTAVAAILLPVVLLLGAYLYLNPRPVETFEIRANKGEKASLTLPEGSTVAINSDSKITYYNDYNRKNRTLKLEGEAFFDVKYNPEKPFIVEFRDIRVKVLGTRFGVKTYEDEKDISIVLNSGKIALTTPREELVMAPDERIVYNKRTQTTIRQKVNARDYTDWQQNRLRFENESLETIIKTISRMHNIDIVFENPKLKTLRYTGTIDNTDIKSVLDALTLTSPIQYKLKDGIVYLF